MTLAVPSLVARARTAQASWGARPINERAAALGDMRRWLVANRDAILESTMRETGKTYEDALVGEVFVLADSLRFWERKAARYLRDTRVPARGPLVLGRKFVVRRRPLGGVRQLDHALDAGNRDSVFLLEQQLCEPAHS